MVLWKEVRARVKGVMTVSVVWGFAVGVGI